MKEIMIIGQFSPPIHGLSKALDTLYNSNNINKSFKLKKINLTNNKKFLSNLFKIFKSNSNLYYLTISQSKFGNIRDIIILNIILFRKKKVLIHLHGGGFRNLLDNEMNNLQKRINIKILRKVDGAIVLGESLKYIFEGIVEENKIFVIKNCVDNEFVINRNEFEDKIKKLENKKNFKILYLSNFIEDKGYKEVLKLAKTFKDTNNSRIKFLFAGKFFSDNDKSEFFNYIKVENIEEIVEYLGVVSGENKKELLKECDYFILITKYKNEGQPISIIEAAANGLRIITTNHAGILDILNQEEMIIVDKENPDIEELKKLLLNELDQTDRLVEVITSNRNKIIYEFSEKKYVENMKSIFQYFCKGE